MSTTVKHHFIPQFYLRRFTNETGQFYIYNTKEGRFVRGGKLFYPSQYFFEKNSNTVELEEGSSDFIEREYSSIDSEIASIFRRIDECSHSLTLDEWIRLDDFIIGMYWRCPYNFNQIKSHVRNAKTSDQLGIDSSKNGNRQQALSAAQNIWLGELKKDDNFLKIMKISLPIITGDEVFNNVQGADHVCIREFPDAHKLPKLISDNPVIYRRPGIESLHRDEFIFKLTHDKVLFRHRRMNQEVMNEIRFMIDVLYLRQAHNYVACTDIGYIKILQDEFKRWKTVEELKREIFSSIFPDKTITALTLGDLLA